MNRRTFDALMNMKQRVLKYAYAERDEDMQYLLFELAAAFVELEGASDYR